MTTGVDSSPLCTTAVRTGKWRKVLGALHEPVERRERWVEPQCARRALGGFLLPGLWPTSGLWAVREYVQVAGPQEEAVLAARNGQIAWQKSSYSGANTECCEVANLPAEIRVRDSKRPERDVLRFSLPTWRVALAYFGRGEPAGGSDEQL
ncbi:DUF397 domain-containing protein [Streptomyces prunicolor]|uniref:DUF397 domain-containing protein n=1 Tax=Streptomyces prunicolor TaxID=67348 RepID=UPI00386825B9